MKHESWRRLMRNIALGIPFAIPIVTAPLNVGGCYPLGYQCPRHVEQIMVTHSVEEGGTAELDCRAICGVENADCEAAGEDRVMCTMDRGVVCPPAGRRPPGELVVIEAAPSDDPMVRWLRQACALEAASVPAFDALAAELAGFDAPSRLARAARRASRDELRHAEVMAGLAARAGGSLHVRVRVAPAPARSLAALAEDNAAEGCVREAWGALEAAVQAVEASDPAVREAMASIASDEARHALLALAIDAWARPRLTEAERMRTADAAAAARADLCDHLRERPRPAGLGLLSPDRALALATVT